MINSVVLVGRITHDLEVKKTNTGKSVCTFTIALDNYSSSQGQRTTSFINCTVWNNQAENLARYCRKGSLIGVEGSLNQRSYVNKNNMNVSVVEVLVSRVVFLDTKKSSQPLNNNNSFDTNELSAPSEVATDSFNFDEFDSLDDSNGSNDIF